jgi:hypothetical protein
LVDDFSRFLLGVRPLPTKEALPILCFLDESNCAGCRWR